MTAPLRIEILPESFWQPRIAQTACAAGPRRLRGFLMAVHGRHAGLTPRAAARILNDQTSLLVPPRQPFGPWQDMRRNVSQVLNAAGDQSARFWAEISPAFLYSRALVPVVHAVSQQVGRSCLFGTAATPGAPGAAEDYDDHQQRFDAAFADFLSDRQRMGAAFWDGLAFSLWSEFLLRSGSRAETGRPDHPVPDADPGVIHWLRRLNPAFSRDRQQHRPRVVHHRINPRQPRPRQGGVTGVRMSHTPDDFGDRLISEAVYPRILQLDRLLYSGYLVRHRPPPLDRRRDVLIVGLFPGSRLIAGYSFASAAWFDAALRAAILLRRAGLLRSDIAAATRAAADGAAVARLSIERLEWLDAADPWAVGVRERLAFLRTAGWLPGFIDRGPGDALPPFGHGCGGADPGYDAALPPAAGDWLRRVTAAKPFLAGADEDRAAVMAQYDAVHVQVVVPQLTGPHEEGVPTATERDLLHCIRRDLGLHGHGHSVSLFRMSPRPFGAFSMVGESRGSRAHGGAEGHGDADAFAGTLVRRMIDSMVGMQNGC
ncbi:MAG: hypothetical protein J2P53_06395 [Bradyrhizobiaceae bacterium]|nr:hypothetical protein [Bradyrhizobiaceae bacterium]